MNGISQSAARKLAAAHGLRGAILIGFTGDSYAVASYGVTREFCRTLKPIVDAIADEIDAGECAVFSKEVWGK